MLNGCDTGGLPLHLVKPLIDNYDIPFLVETGTANGDSARLAATLFTKVWTMEVVEDRAEVKDGPPNVEFLQGDSAELLPEVIAELIELKGGSKRQFVLFYLDAHYSGDTPNESGFPECPLLSEIEAISKYGEDANIIIDDARLFFGQPPHPHDPTEWPSVCEIFVLLKEKFPYHHITITDDYILCISHHVREPIDKEWRERFTVRYPNDSDKLKEQARGVYKAIIDYLK